MSGRPSVSRASLGISHFQKIAVTGWPSAIAPA